LASDDQLEKMSILEQSYSKYILGALLLLVWGLVFYRIYQAFAPEDDLSVPSIQFANWNKEQAVNKEGYQLALDYEDPFLKEQAYHFSSPRPRQQMDQKPSFAQKEPKRSKKREKKDALPKMPQVRYQGYAISQSDSIAIIKIDNQFYPNLKVGEVVKEIRLMAIFPDSIWLNWRAGRHTILKK